MAMITPCLFITVRLRSSTSCGGFALEVLAFCSCVAQWQTPPFLFLIFLVVKRKERGCCAAGAIVTVPRARRGSFVFELFAGRSKMRELCDAVRVVRRRQRDLLKFLLHLQYRLHVSVSVDNPRTSATSSTSSHDHKKMPPSAAGTSDFSVLGDATDSGAVAKKQQKMPGVTVSSGAVLNVGDMVRVNVNRRTVKAKITSVEPFIVKVETAKAGWEEVESEEDGLKMDGEDGNKDAFGSATEVDADGLDLPGGVVDFRAGGASSSKGGKSSKSGDGSGDADDAHATFLGKSSSSSNTIKILPAQHKALWDEQNENQMTKEKLLKFAAPLEVAVAGGPRDVDDLFRECETAKRDEQRKSWKPAKWEEMEAAFRRLLLGKQLTPNEKEARDEWWKLIKAEHQAGQQSNGRKNFDIYLDVAAVGGAVKPPELYWSERSEVFMTKEKLAREKKDCAAEQLAADDEDPEVGNAFERVQLAALWRRWLLRATKEDVDSKLDWLKSLARAPAAADPPQNNQEKKSRSMKRPAPSAISMKIVRGSKSGTPSPSAKVRDDVEALRDKAKELLAQRKAYDSKLEEAQERKKNYPSIRVWRAVCEEIQNLQHCRKLLINRQYKLKKKITHLEESYARDLSPLDDADAQCERLQQETSEKLKKQKRG